MRAFPKAIVLLSLVAVALTLGLVATEALQARPSDANEKRAELKVSIRAATPESTDTLRFHVTFENVSEEDTVINLGDMLGNGKALLPHAFRLILTDANGQSKELHFFDKRYPGVAGRLDDYAVPLRAGSAYTVKVAFNNYFCAKSNEYGIKLKPGRYGVRATFIGKGSGLDHGQLMRFWKGELESDVVHFEIGQQG